MEVKMILVDPMRVEQTDRASFYRGASIALIVFDISKPETFAKLETWFKKIREFLGSTKLIKIYLIGNKVDLEEKITESEVLELLTEWKKRLEVDILFIKTSTKTPNAREAVHHDTLSKQIAIDIGMAQSTYSKEKAEEPIGKVILLGELGVGRTSLKRRIEGEGFTTNYMPTIGVDLAVKQVTLTPEDLKQDYKIEESFQVDESYSIKPTIHQEPEKRKIFTGISYFDRMIPYKNFDLIIELSHLALQEEKGKTNLLTGARKTHKIEQLEFTIDTIQVVPLCPGCLVSPPSRIAHLAKPNQKFSFIITPLIAGKIEGKVEFRTLEHEIISQISIPSISRPSRIARIIAIVGILIGVTPTGLEYMGININTTLQNRLNQDIPALASIFQGLNWLLLGELILMILTLAFAGILTYKFRPRKTISFKEMDYETVGA